MPRWPHLIAWLGVLAVFSASVARRGWIPAGPALPQQPTIAWVAGAVLLLLGVAACNRGVIVDPAGPPGAIVGTIVDEDGRPVPEARIRLVYRGMEGTVTKTSRSDAKGRFSFVGLEMRPWRIEVEAPGYLDGARTVTVARNTETCTLRLARAKQRP